MYTEQYLRDNFRMKCVDYAQWSKADLVRAVMDQTSIRETIAATKTWRAGQSFGVCYVIGLEGLNRAKIGFTVNPSKRLEQLSVGLWETPKCHALFWSHASNAKFIEFKALALAKQRGHRLKGEWVGLTGEEAAQLVLEAIWGETHFTDSANFMAEWFAAALVAAPRNARREAVSMDAMYERAAERGY